MEGCSGNREAYPQLLDLIPNEKEWLGRRDEVTFGVSVDKKLELRLGPPGEGWFEKEMCKDDNRERDKSLLSLGSFSSMASNTNNKISSSSNNNYISVGAKRGSGEETWLINQNQKLSSSEKPIGTIFYSPWASGSSPSPSSSAFQMKTQQQPKVSFLQFPAIPQSIPVKAKESLQTCSTKVVELQNPEKKACSPASAAINSSQKRTAPLPVVGWPPIRSFRKNLANSSSSKPTPELHNPVPTVETSKKPEDCRKGLFVKINMDGVPIGRKVDLKAYDSYEELSSAVDELFRGLLAAQRDSPAAAGNQNNTEEVKAITGLLDGSGEYTLVYEDNEGDRMLVGDVPWLMFVSAVKRLRVLKSSELSSLCIGSSKKERHHLTGLKRGSG